MNDIVKIISACCIVIAFCGTGSVMARTSHAPASDKVVEFRNCTNSVDGTFKNYSCCDKEELIPADGGDFQKCAQRIGAAFIKDKIKGLCEDYCKPKECGGVKNITGPVGPKKTTEVNEVCTKDYKERAVTSYTCFCNKTPPKNPMPDSLIQSITGVDKL